MTIYLNFVKKLSALKGIRDMANWIRELFNSWHSFSDPYSPNLARFFKDTVKKEPYQYRLFDEFNNVPELSNFIDGHTDKKGNLVKFEINDKEKYEAKKKELGLV